MSTNWKTLKRNSVKKTDNKKRHFNRNNNILAKNRQWQKAKDNDKKTNRVTKTKKNTLHTTEKHWHKKSDKKQTHNNKKQTHNDKNTY